jgi:peptide-methionine (R)-S-oxide reductase
MHRRLFLGGSLAAAVALALGANAATDSSKMNGQIPAIKFNDTDWRKLLASDQYDVLFKEATESAWSSALNNEKRDGNYICSACYLPLFLSATKFDSGTGWPSFYQPIEGNTGSKRDWRLILPRTEYHCARCEGHQGHVFNDGPQPTGERWCNNGLALKFVPEGEALPELRG